MANEEKLEELLKESKNGIITSKQITDAGLHRSVLQKLQQNDEIYRYSRGIYVCSNSWEDDFSLIQHKYSRGVFSYDTALYLHNYSDRTPSQYTMTFPKGYNSPSIKNENIIIKRVVPKNYLLGITEIKSPCGNPIRVYNLERTLCDILRGSGSDIQIIVPAMKKYASFKGKDIYKLMQYAEQLHVRQKVLRYMEVLL